MKPNLRSLVTAAAITGLALGTVGLAQPGAAHRELMRPHSGALRITLPTPVAPGLTVLRGGATSLAWNPAAWPIGTTIELRFFDADPAEDVDARTVLGLTVGVDSEVAFAQRVDAALAEAGSWEAAYLVVAVGETRRVVALPDDGEAAGRRAAGAHALRLATGGMSIGDSVKVLLYDADPANGAAARATLTFTYGVDSEIGFRAALAEAAADPAFAEVVTSPRSWTVDLKAVQARRAAVTGDRFERMRGRMDDLAERLPGVVERMRQRIGALQEALPWPPAHRWSPGWR